LFYVWWSFTQPKAKMIWYLDSAHQNSWKSLSFINSFAPTLLTNFQVTLQQWQNHGSSMKILISNCLTIFHSNKSKNGLTIGFSMSKHLEITLFQLFIWSHILETNPQVILQHCKAHGSSIMKSTYQLLFEFLALNQKQKCFVNWVQHFKTFGSHSFINSYVPTHHKLISK